MRAIIECNDKDVFVVLDTNACTVTRKTKAEIQEDVSNKAILGYNFNSDTIEAVSVASCILREVYIRRVIGSPVAFLGSWCYAGGFYAVLGDTQKQEDVTPFVRVVPWSDFLQLCALRTPLTNVSYIDDKAYVSNELLCNQMNIDITNLVYSDDNDLVCMDIDTPFDVLPSFVTTNIEHNIAGVVIKPSDMFCQMQETQTDADYLDEGYLLIYQPDCIDNADELRCALLSAGDVLFENSIGYALHTYDVTVNNGIFRGSRPENRIEVWFNSYNTEYAAEDKANMTQIVNCARGYEGNLEVALRLQKQFADCVNELRDELF